MAVGGGWDVREEGSVTDRHPTPMLEEILASGRAVYLPG
jgi:hypothetical protein